VHQCIEEQTIELRRVDAPKALEDIRANGNGLRLRMPHDLLDILALAVFAQCEHRHAPVFPIGPESGTSPVRKRTLTEHALELEGRKTPDAGRLVEQRLEQQVT